MNAGSRGLLAAVFLALMSCQVFAEGKLAFVVGISRYPNLEASSQLDRAVPDAVAVADVLQTLGFKVTRVTENGTLDAILGSFDLFKASIQPGDTVLFYYAGHGISLSDGNYLIPADIPLLKPTDERKAEHMAIAERDFTRDIRAAGARVAIIVIDACRNNPFPAQGRRALGDNERGFRRLEAAEGAFSLYSAREGQSALDRLPGKDPDPNSVFTRVFLKALKTPGLSLSALGDQVRDEVADLAQSAGESQVPAVYNDMVGARIVFLSGLPVVGPERAPPTSNDSAGVTRDTDLNPNVALCDRLAASPDDELRPRGSKGVDIDKIDISSAVKACRAAHVAVPTSPRVAIELGRAVWAANDVGAALSLFREAAEASYPEGMHLLAVMYSTPYGVPKNDAEAARWYRKAAASGNVAAMVEIGRMLLLGIGVAKDQVEAESWLEKAAVADDAQAMFMIGDAESGKDDAKAAFWFRKAADRGDAPSMLRLAQDYVDGMGVAKDETEAVRWFKKAADTGDVIGMMTLALMYKSGFLVTKSEAEALPWIQKLADAGQPWAMYQLGVLYANGAGVRADRHEADRWFRLAADAGYSEPKKEEGTRQTKPVTKAGEATLLDGWKRYGQSGFAFLTEKRVAWNDPRADVLAERYGNGPVTFYLPGTSSGKGDQGEPAFAGISETTLASIDDTGECPKAGYAHGFFNVKAGQTYCLISRDGHSFALAQIIEFDEKSIRFKWRFNKQRSAKF